MILGLYSKTFTSSGTWTAPTNLAFPPAVYAQGPGANGGSGASVGGSGGGGGGFGGEPALGGVAPGTVLTVTIPAANSASATTVTGGSVTVTGNGASTVTGGAASTNTVAFKGGNGGGGSGIDGGGGGGSGGSTGAGGNGAAITGGAAGTGAAGPPSLAGATGGAGATGLGGTGGAGTGPGAGGGGGGKTGGTGGAGKAGQVIIIWAVRLPDSPRRGSAPLRMTGSSRGLTGAPVPIIPAPFTPPGGPSRGRPGTARGKSGGARGAPFVFIPPAPFHLPGGPAKGAPAARRGTSKGSPGAPLVVTPPITVSPFTAPTGPSRGRTAIRQGLSRGLAGIRGVVSPFTGPGKPSRGTQAARPGRSSGHQGAKFVPPPPIPSPFTPPRGPTKGRMAAKPGRSGAGSATGQGAPVTPRNLIISLASAAGTDDYGNTFPQGIQVGAPTIGPQVVIVPARTGTASGIGFPMPSPDLANPPNIAAFGGNAAAMVISGPNLAKSGVRDWVQIEFWSNDDEGDPSRLQFNTIDTNGNVTEAGNLVNGTGWSFFDDVTVYNLTTINPLIVQGGELFTSGGALWYRSPGGSETQLAPGP